MKKIFFILVFVFIYLNAKSQNQVDSIANDLIKNIENNLLKGRKFFDNIYSDTLHQTIMITNEPLGDNFFVFDVKKTQEEFIFISINEMNRGKSLGSYVFQNQKYFYLKNEFEVEINSQFFIQKLKDFKKYMYYSGATK